MKFSSLTLITLTGLLSSTLALPNPHSKPEVSTSHAGIDAIINATEHNLSAREASGLYCFNSQDNPSHKWAANGAHALSEVGKKNDNIKGKNLYDVTRRFCSESNAKKMTGPDDFVEKIYWFQNAWKDFGYPFVPVTVSVYSDGVAGVVNGKACDDAMTKIITGCIAEGKSRMDHFRGGAIWGENEWQYMITCGENACFEKQ